MISHYPGIPNVVMITRRDNTLVNAPDCTG